jgi:hypothetical protein
MTRVTQESVTALQQKERNSRWLGWSSLVFAFLQSACTFFLATSGIGTLIGFSSLATISVASLGRIHQDAIRIPMMLVALTGALINLYRVWRVRSLRARPASQWRVQPVTAGQKRSERLQIVISILTLILLVAEVWTHQVMHHRQ